MKIPLPGWLAGIKHRPANLDAAMLRIASVVEPADSFCVREDLWRHGSAYGPRRFQVTLFRGKFLAVQWEGLDLDKTVESALDEYRRKK